MQQLNDTICALSTPQGMGAIAVIRLSGQDALEILGRCFSPFSQRHQLEKAQGYQNVFGKIVDGKRIIDEVMVAVYKNPHSYTGQNLAEINCHGSVYIQEQILKLLFTLGARAADPGEFTFRSFFNGKMDLSQAEAVADLIASENQAAHTLAMQQMRGGFSAEIKKLRDELIHFAAMIELELDFSEEDVEFANREELETLLHRVKQVLSQLLESFDTGNVLKNGLPVAIVGAPNAGKSTLLNALLNEEKAIVTEVAGTTRDAIEDELNLGGVKFRFIDTAGIRETKDLVESIGIEKTYEKIKESKVVLYLFNASLLLEQAELIQSEIAQLKAKSEGKTLLILANKVDLWPKNQKLTLPEEELIPISALQKTGLEVLKNKLLDQVNINALNQSNTIVSNARHAHALQQSLADIVRVEEGLEAGLSGDFLAMDIREAFKHLGEIIGEVDTDRDVLGTIFGKFCIGK